MRLDILFRSCSRVFAVHGNSRMVNAPKSEITLRCLNSLIRSMQLAGGQESTALSLTVIDDHSDPECIAAMKSLLATCNFPATFVALEETGNGKSLLYNYEYAKARCEDLIYFVEDDYLHAPEAIKELLSAQKQLSFFIKQDVVLFPCDYPTLYLKHTPSAILVAGDRYWRNIGQTTATCLVTKKTLLEHWDKYMALTAYVPGGDIHEGNTINQIYREVPCFSPMPSLTVHMDDSTTLSPLVNWTQWWTQSELTGGIADNPVIPLATPFRDERGDILPLVDKTMNSAVFISSKKDSVRANHFHHTDWHYCYVTRGSLDYYFRPAGSKEKPRCVRVKSGEMFYTPPLVEHAMVFCEETDMICLGKNARDQASYEAGITRAQVYPV